MSYESIIGLEIHVELRTRSKMFCSCPADHFGKEPNTQTCPVCLGLPGALPVPNKRAIEWTALTGLALGCEIPQFSKFDRKNYFYPDLPKGYQISQYDLPLARNGKWKMPARQRVRSQAKSGGENGKWARIRRVHLEEDTGKLIHKTVESKKVTLVDFNRSGVPLMEIVTEPDFRSVEEVRLFLKDLQQLIRYLGVSDCDMEKGSMRLEINVSLRKEEGRELPDYKVEIKNLNSFRFVEKALNYEIERQTKILSSGGKLSQETRGFDENKGVTFLQRVKEEAHDYRYFPEPDIPPIRWIRDEIEKFRDSLPELPEQKRERILKVYKLPENYVRVLTESIERADYFEGAVLLGRPQGITPKEIANAIVNKRIKIKKLTPKEYIDKLLKQKKRFKISLPDLKRAINEVIGDNPKAVEDYKKGKTTTVEFLVGQVAGKTRGQADPNQTRKLLVEKLR